MPIDCFDNIMPALSKEFNDRTKGMTEDQQRAEGIKMALEQHKKLFVQLQVFKKKVGQEIEKKYVAPVIAMPVAEPKSITNGQENSQAGAASNEVTGGTTKTNNNQAAPAENNEPNQTPLPAPKPPQAVPTPKKIVRKFKNEEVQNEIDQAWDDFFKPGGNLTSGGLDPRKIEMGVKLVGLYIKAGKYKFSEIAEDAYAKYGPKLKEIFTELKAVYSAYFNSTTDDIAAKMDESVRSISYEQIENGANLDDNNKNKENANSTNTNTVRPATSGVAGQQSSTGTKGNGTKETTKGTSGTSSGTGQQSSNGTNGQGQNEGGSTSGSNGNNNSTNGGNNSNQNAGSGVSTNTQQVGRVKPLPENINNRNHIIEPNDVIVPEGGPAKVAANMDAIILLRTLEAEDRNATPEEKKILAKFVGWGGLANYLNEISNGYEEQILDNIIDGTAQEIGYYGKEILAAGEKMDFAGKNFDEIAKEIQRKYAQITSQNFGLRKFITNEKLSLDIARNYAINKLLGAAEYQTAKNSTINAHYTDRFIISPIWDLIRKLGYKGGSTLESSAGIGHFFGLMPKDLQDNSNLTGVELDQLTGRLLKKLYPDSNIQVKGFETTNFPNNSFDLAVSNVPFGRAGLLTDAKNPDIDGFNLHNYFIAKNLKQLKPGGIAVMITSKSTMDNAISAKARRWFLSPEGGNSELVGAIRLPNNAFDKNAGTQVTTDVLVFQKRNDTVVRNTNAFAATNLVRSEVIDGEMAEINVNEYYIKNPDNMIGEMKFAFEVGSGGLYGKKDATLHAAEGTDVPAKAAELFDKFPTDILSTEATPEDESVATNTKIGKMFAENGKIYISNGDQGFEPVFKKPEHKKIAIAYLGVRDAIRDLVAKELSSNDADAIEADRAALNKGYDEFEKKYGSINKNDFLYDFDIEFSIAAAAEDVKETTVVNPKGGRSQKTVEVKKAAIFSQRINYPRAEPTTAANLSDAIKISISYRNNISPEYLAQLTGSTTEKVIEDIIDQKLAYQNPLNGLYETPEEYLSGNVRKKLREATDAALTDSNYDRNVKELKKIQPEDKAISQIPFKMGVSWIPAFMYKDFIKEKLGIDINIKFLDKSGIWVMDKEKMQGARDSNNTSTYAVREHQGIDIIEDILANRTTVVNDRISLPGGGTSTIKNEALTGAAKDMQDRLVDEFRNWVATHDTNGAIIEKAYNEKFNNLVEKKQTLPSFEYFPGASTAMKLRQHQFKSVQRGVSGDPTLLAHGVGTGKTAIMQTIAMEWRRLKTAKKPLIVVQNSTLRDFAAKFQKLYPGAKLLVSSEADKGAAERRRFYARIAQGDWDAIIIPQSQFNSIPDNPDRVAAFLQERIEEMKEILGNTEDRFIKARLEKEIEGLESDIDKAYMSKEELAGIKSQSGEMYVDEETGEVKKGDGGGKKKGGKQKVKSEAEKVLKLNARIQKQATRRTDNVMNFEDLGIDGLIVDEAHEYKKLGFQTGLQNIRGIDTGVSQRALSLKMKTEAVKEKTGGKNIVYATGTPITNTMAESWTMMRFLQPEVLEEMGIQYFDQFAATFTQVVPSLEQNAGGRFEVVQRMKEFVNAKQLQATFKKMADVVTTDDIPEFLSDPDNAPPKLAGGGFTSVLIPISAPMGAAMKRLTREYDSWKASTGQEKKDKSWLPLVLYQIAKKASIDLRIIDPRAVDDPESKVNYTVKNALKLYKESTENKGTQMIFSDNFQSGNSENVQTILGVPKGLPPFNLYKDIKEKLIAGGVPASEIIIMSDTTTDTAKLAMQDKMNSGEVRFVIGSTNKMGVGVNAHERMIGLHHIDAPDRPDQFTQRNGRILRSGNIFTKLGIPVHIFTYGIKDTRDATSYGRLRDKEKFVVDFMTGEGGDTVEDTGAEDESAAAGSFFTEMSASLSGSKFATELIFAEKDLRTETNRASAYYQKKQESEYKLANKIKGRENIKDLIKAADEAKIVKDRTFLDNKIISVEINGVTTTEKLSDAVDAMMKDIQTKYSAEQKILDAEAKAAGLKTAQKQKNPLTKFKINGVSSSLVYYGGDYFELSIPELTLKERTVLSGTSLLSVARNHVKELSESPNSLRDLLKKEEANIETLKKNLTETYDEQKLIDLQDKVAELKQSILDESAAKEAADKAEAKAEKNSPSEDNGDEVTIEGEFDISYNEYGDSEIFENPVFDAKGNLISADNYDVSSFNEAVNGVIPAEQITVTTESGVKYNGVSFLLFHRAKLQQTNQRLQKITPTAYTALLAQLKKAFPRVGITMFNDGNAQDILGGTEGAKELRSKNGTIYGFVKDGKVYLNEDKINANTPIHEYAHIWQQMLPNTFKQGIELLKSSKAGKALIAKVKANPAYANLSQSEIEAEALVIAIGDKGESVFNDSPTMMAKFKTWLSDFFKKVGDRLGIKNLTPDEKFEKFVRSAAGDLLGGKEIKESAKNDGSARFQVDDIYHGSPYSFDKFTTSKMGTGEGAQAFGWGLYFTDVKGIAEGYANALAKAKFDSKSFGKENEGIANRAILNIESAGSVDKAINFIEGLINKNPKGDNSKSQEIIDFLKENKDKFKVEKNLYKVSLHEGKTPSQYDWLVWDKHATKAQIEKVINVLRNAEDLSQRGRDLLRELTTPILRMNNYYGKDLYYALSDAMGQKKASLELLKQGIDGVKYPAESIARGTNSDNARGFNYVVFDENAITVKDKVQFMQQPDDKVKAVITELRAQGISDEDIKEFYMDLGDSEAEIDALLNPAGTGNSGGTQSAGQKNEFSKANITEEINSIGATKEDTNYESILHRQEVGATVETSELAKEQRLILALYQSDSKKLIDKFKDEYQGKYLSKVLSAIKNINKNNVKTDQLLSIGIALENEIGGIREGFIDNEFNIPQTELSKVNSAIQQINKENQRVGSKVLNISKLLYNWYVLDDKYSREIMTEDQQKEKDAISDILEDDDAVDKAAQQYENNEEEKVDKAEPIKPKKPKVVRGAKIKAEIDKELAQLKKDIEDLNC